MTSRLIKQSLISATLITVGGNILGRVFGFGREAVLAKYFGTSAVLDTFILAFTLPELIALVLFTALPVALIPAVSKSNEPDSQPDDSQKFWAGLIWFGACFALLSAILFLMRSQVMTWLAPGLTTEQVATGEQLLAIMAPYIFFRGLEAYFRSWCFARKHFVAPALSSVVLNTAVIVSVFLLYDQMGIVTLAYGWLAGSMLLVGFNGVVALRLIKPKLRFNLALPWVKNLVLVLVAVAALELITMSYAVLDRYLASAWLGPGPISALRYATTLISIPGGILVAAFNIASFPWIADLVGRGDSERLRTMYIDSVRLLIFAMGLVMVGLLIFSTDIVRVAFFRGAFDNESLNLTTAPFSFYALGLVFQAVYAFQMRYYYAQRALLRLGVILGGMFIVKLLISLILIEPMGHAGLALATTLARVVGFFVMTIDLSRALSLHHRELFWPFIPKVMISLGTVAIVWLSAAIFWPSTPDQSLWSLFVRLALLAVLGIANYLGIGALLKLNEPRRMLNLIASQFKRR